MHPRRSASASRASSSRRPVPPAPVRRIDRDPLHVRGVGDHPHDAVADRGATVLGDDRVPGGRGGGELGGQRRPAPGVDAHGRRLEPLQGRQVASPASRRVAVTAPALAARAGGRRVGGGTAARPAAAGPLRPPRPGRGRRRPGRAAARGPAAGRRAAGRLARPAACPARAVRRGPSAGRPPALRTPPVGVVRGPVHLLAPRVRYHDQRRPAPRRSDGVERADAVQRRPHDARGRPRGDQADPQPGVRTRAHSHGDIGEVAWRRSCLGQHLGEHRSQQLPVPAGVDGAPRRHTDVRRGPPR